jgi:hypothetical protein
MLTFQPVTIERDLKRGDPLYVGNFFNLRKMWWTKRKARQGLIISIALGWYYLLKRNPTACGYDEEEILLTHLTKQVKDAKVILERFFVIKRLGFNFNEATRSPTIVTPKKLSKEMIDAIEELVNEVRFNPGEEPTSTKLVKSDVTVQHGRDTMILARLRREREDLIPAVTWLLKRQNPITFYYEPCGSLQARDKSVWPVKAIETWPGWLRAELFGTVVDIENSYCQFLVQKLAQKHALTPRRFELQYPDIIRADRDKTAFRWELCALLRLEPSDENVHKVKKLLMALANGSNASPALMTNGSGRSEAVRVVHEIAPHLLPSELIEVGKRLSAIAKQFRAAKRDLCIQMFGKPTLQNQKKIFTLYFEWEREARYKIWDAVGRTGLMLHDGLDGVVSGMTEVELTQHIAAETNIRVSVEHLEAA